jgi:hypothetical protein
VGRLGHLDWKERWAGLKIKTKEISGTGLGCKGTRAKMENGLEGLVSELIQGFGLKSRILNFFKSNYELDLNKMKSNQLFGNFSNPGIGFLV